MELNRTKQHLLNENNWFYFFLPSISLQLDLYHSILVLIDYILIYVCSNIRSKSSYFHSFISFQFVLFYFLSNGSNSFQLIFLFNFAPIDFISFQLVLLQYFLFYFVPVQSNSFQMVMYFYFILFSFHLVPIVSISFHFVVIDYISICISFYCYLILFQLIPCQSILFQIVQFHRFCLFFQYILLQLVLFNPLWLSVKKVLNERKVKVEIGS